MLAKIWAPIGSVKLTHKVNPQNEQKDLQKPNLNALAALWPCSINGHRLCGLVTNDPNAQFY